MALPSCFSAIPHKTSEVILVRLEGPESLGRGGPGLSYEDVTRSGWTSSRTTVRRTILRGGGVLVLEAEEGMAEVLEAVRPGNPIKDAPRGVNRYRPHRPV